MICRKDYSSRDSLGVLRLGHGVFRGAAGLTDCLATADFKIVVA